MPKVEGLKVLAHIRASPKTAVVIITAYGSAANAVEAMKLGAIDFWKSRSIRRSSACQTEEHSEPKVLDDLMHLADLARP